MSDDVRAAAERLLPPLADVIDAPGDAELVARAWLAEHPADDGEPVSAEWLMVTGWVDVAEPGGGPLYTFCRPDHGGAVLTLEGDHRCLMAFLGHPDGAPWPCDIYTRGQVRELLRALGIEVKR